jgi:hypothetical protein
MPMRRPHAALLLAALAAAPLGCAGEPRIDRPFAAEVAEARRLLVEAAAGGPVRLELDGLPSSLGPRRAAELAAEGVSGVTVAFATTAAPNSPRLLLAFDLPPQIDTGRLCASPSASVPTTPHRLTAVLCQGQRAVASVTGVAAGGAPADTERLVWRTTAMLFPDDYAETYGFNLFGSRLRLGLGGSFGF